MENRQPAHFLVVHRQGERIIHRGLRLRQQGNEGLPSYRQIAIDGAVPFEELLAYSFRLIDIGDPHSSDAEDPYRFI